MENSIHTRSTEKCLGDTGTYSVTVLLFNSRLKKHIQVSDTDNFTKIEMTAVESAVQVRVRFCSGRSSPTPVMTLP